MTRTNSETHRIITENYHRNPKLGHDEHNFGNGPRYCPSRDKKLFMFPDKLFHQVWLEPEGLNSNVVYPNGISTGLPRDA